MEAFASAHQKPSAGVSTLEALAWKSRVEGPTIAPTVDARRGEVYGALYGWSDGRLNVVREPVVMTPTEWFTSLPSTPMVFCGDGAVRYRDFIARPEWSLRETDLYLASAITEMALRLDRGPLSPLYVRRTEAEIAHERQHESLASSNTQN
jgi:tRNA threonylcarbamoyladenosine biosynthesis protein TsaB